MTLPDERYRAMKCGYQFLLDLCNPSVTPRVPKEVRERAKSVLRHYPSDYHFDMIVDALPSEFSEDNNLIKNASDN